MKFSLGNCEGITVSVDDEEYILVFKDETSKHLNKKEFLALKELLDNVNDF